MAWLNAVPKPPAGSKRAAMTDQGPQLTRIERMKRDKVTPKLPPNPMPHLIGHLMEIGLSEAAGMGAAPLSWLTIDVWQRITGVELSPWEARLIRKLSVEYLAEGRRAESETCPPPWRAAVTRSEREAETARLMAVLG